MSCLFRVTCGFIVGLGFVVAAATTTLADDAERGALIEFRKQLEPLFRVQLVDGRLSVDRSSWERHARKGNRGIEVILEKIGEAAGCTASGGTRSGDYSSLTRSGGQVSVQVEERTGYVHVRVTEREAPHRVLEVEQRDGAAFRICLFADDSMVVLTQSKSLKLHLIQTSEEDVFQSSPDAYRDLLSVDNAKAVLKRLADVGVSLPVLRDDR